MENGYKVLWTDHALEELGQTIEYLEINWTERELRKFATKLDHTIEIAAKNPEIFPVTSERKGIRKAVVDKYNTLYYRIIGNAFEIISIFASRQDPDKRKK